ncbi:hypothetical protein F2P81_006775 [Scophthalmus maximus]|uniref:NDRG, Alpha/Beta hydrolase fold protein n=1 Tax=Scophthalmus maximus TaxID=52904 RepID=A0A6A4T3Z0_SCOMX|nr:hypothetical protein F2P81_006775 [Scophthalmus maximus]
MAGIKEQQFTEEKPLLPEQRGADSDMPNNHFLCFAVSTTQQDKGDEASGGPPCPASPAGPAPLNHPSPPSRPTHRWHVIARHWLRQTRRRTSGVLPDNCEQLMPAGDWKETQFRHIPSRAQRLPGRGCESDAGRASELISSVTDKVRKRDERRRELSQHHERSVNRKGGNGRTEERGDRGGQTKEGFKSIVGIGVGAGAYILAKFALIFPDLVEGLVLLNIDPNGKGWIDWAATKVPVFNKIKHPDLPRRDLEMNRSGTVLNAKTLKCPVMLVVGDNAPAEEGVVECNSKLDPTNTTFLKMADSGGLPQLTQPGKLTEAFKYFLQGMGYKEVIFELCSVVDTVFISHFPLDTSRAQCFFMNVSRRLQQILTDSSSSAGFVEKRERERERAKGNPLRILIPEAGQIWTSAGEDGEQTSDTRLRDGKGPSVNRLVQSFDSALLPWLRVSGRTSPAAFREKRMTLLGAGSVDVAHISFVNSVRTFCASGLTSDESVRSSGYIIPAAAAAESVVFRVHISSV